MKAYIIIGIQLLLSLSELYFFTLPRHPMRSEAAVGTALISMFFVCSIIIVSIGFVIGSLIALARTKSKNQRLVWVVTILAGFFPIVIMPLLVYFMLP